jgi:hypothetical protein
VRHVGFPERHRLDRRDRRLRLRLDNLDIFRLYRGLRSGRTTWFRR